MSQGTKAILLAILLGYGVARATALDTYSLPPLPPLPRDPSLVDEPSAPEVQHPTAWFSSPYVNVFALGGGSLFFVVTLVGLFGVFGDRELAERPRLWRRRRDLLQQWFERAPIGIGLWDPLGKPLHTNEQITRLLGLSDGRPLSEARPRVWQRMQDGLAGGPRVLEVTGEFAREFLFQAHPLRDESNRVLAIGLTASPATRRLHADAERDEMARVVYSAAHDLREPLRTALVSLQLLRSTRKDWTAGTLEIFERVLNALRGMSQLTDSLLTFTRADQSEPERADVSLDDVVDTACAQLRVLITEKHAEIRRGWLPTVHADRTQLVQVFQNLIGNAIKFHRAGEPPVIEIVALAHADGCEISIRDNGVGLGSADLEKVFEPFQRAANSAKLPGSGIGLATCRRIIERHGGRIWATHNANRQGATFRFTLPPKA